MKLLSFILLVALLSSCGHQDCRKDDGEFLGVKKMQWNAGEIQVIEASVVAGDLIVSKARDKSEQITAQVLNSEKPNNYFHWELQGEMLILFTQRNNDKNVDHKTGIRLTLPRKIYDRITLRSVSGDVNIEKLSAKIFELNSVSGDINAKVDNIGSFLTQNVSGTSDLRLSQSRAEASVVSVSGKVVVQSHEGHRLKTSKSKNADIKVQSVSGNINLIIDN